VVPFAEEAPGESRRLYFKRKDNPRDSEVAERHSVFIGHSRRKGRGKSSIELQVQRRGRTRGATIRHAPELKKQMSDTLSRRGTLSRGLGPRSKKGERGRGLLDLGCGAG